MIDMKVLRLIGIILARVVLEAKHWNIHPLYPDMAGVLVRRAELRDAWKRTLAS